MRKERAEWNLCVLPSTSGAPPSVQGRRDDDRSRARDVELSGEDAVLSAMAFTYYLHAIKATFISLLFSRSGHSLTHLPFDKQALRVSLRSFTIVSRTT